MAITSASVPSAANASPLFVRIVVVAALGATALVHLLLAPTYGAASAVVGAAFVAGGVAAVVAAVWLVVRDSDIAWDLAAAVSAGMLGGLVLSATVGLFGIKTPQLTAPHIVAIVAEISVLVAWGATRLRRH